MHWGSKTLALQAALEHHDHADKCYVQQFIFCTWLWWLPGDVSASESLAGRSELRPRSTQSMQLCHGAVGCRLLYAATLCLAYRLEPLGFIYNVTTYMLMLIVVKLLMMHDWCKLVCV